MTDVLRILLVDDHPVVRDGLRALLESSGGMTVVGEAGDGATAVELAAALRPDVVIMDLAMPGMDGIGATRRIKSAAPTCAVLVLTMSDSDASLASAVTHPQLATHGGRPELVRSKKAATRRAPIDSRGCGRCRRRAGEPACAIQLLDDVLAAIRQQGLQPR